MFALSGFTGGEDNRDDNAGPGGLLPLVVDGGEEVCENYLYLSVDASIEGDRALVPVLVLRPGGLLGHEGSYTT